MLEEIGVKIILAITKYCNLNKDTDETAGGKYKAIIQKYKHVYHARRVLEIMKEHECLDSLVKLKDDY